MATLCDSTDCKSVATHSLCDGEYHYCDQHYIIVGTCDKCHTPIHESWEIAVRESGTYCYACSKDVDNEIIEYDDKGVLCRYTEENGWEPLEEHCVECGYTECECEH